MEKLIADLTAAQEDYEKAVQAASFARSRETDALNKLNDAQREVDKALEALKKLAPSGSNWKRPDRNSGTAVFKPAA